MPKGPKGEKRPRDVSQLGKAIVDIATGEVEDEEAEGDTPLSPAERGLAAGVTDTLWSIEDVVQVVDEAGAIQEKGGRLKSVPRAPIGTNSR